MEPLDQQRPHKNATLLARECFPSKNYSLFLDICTYIENHKEDLLKKEPFIHTYKNYEIFVENEKVYLLTDFEIGSGIFKTFFKGLDYFKQKIIAYHSFKKNPVVVTQEVSKKFTPKEIFEKHERYKKTY